MVQYTATHSRNEQVTSGNQRVEVEVARAQLQKENKYPKKLFI